MSASEVLRNYINEKLERDADSIITLKGGAAIDLVDRAIQLALRNVTDINTTMGTREVTLKIKIVPLDEGRNSVQYQFEVPPPKLCGQESYKCLADLKIDGGGRLGHYSKEKVDRQKSLPFGNVQSITDR